MALWSEWIDWKGGECPVDPSADVQVCDLRFVRRQGPASAFFWRHEGYWTDIIKYRVLACTPEPVELVKVGWHYPYLGIGSSGQIVYFTAPRTGMVVRKGFSQHSELGDFATTWPEEFYKRFDGTVTLGNGTE